MTGVASTGETGIGVLFKISDGGAPPTFATVANVTQLSGGGASTNMVDATHLNSPDFFSEKKPGLKSSTDWTGTFQWDPTDPTTGSANGMKKYQNDRTLQTFRLDPSQLGITIGLEVDAYVSEIGNIEVTPEGLMTCTFTLAVTGKVREVSL